MENFNGKSHINNSKYEFSIENLIENVYRKFHFNISEYKFFIKNFQMKISKELFWEFSYNFSNFFMEFLVSKSHDFSVAFFSFSMKLSLYEKKENRELRMRKWKKEIKTNGMNERRCWSIIPWCCDAVDVMMIMMMIKTNYMLGFNVFGYFVNGPNIKKELKELTIKNFGHKHNITNNWIIYSMTYSITLIITMNNPVTPYSMFFIN